MRVSGTLGSSVIKGIIEASVSSEASGSLEMVVQLMDLKFSTSLVYRLLVMLEHSDLEFILTNGKVFCD